jgi:hypothetical protein
MHHGANYFLGSLEFSTSAILFVVDNNACFHSCFGLARAGTGRVLLLKPALEVLHSLMVCKKTYKTYCNIMLRHS